MKYICASIIVAINLTICNGQDLQNYVDERDDQSYEIILIDSLWWFNQNLNYTTSGSVSYSKKEITPTIYNRLYSLKEAKSVCPKNWRLPSVEEFDSLLEKMDGEIVASGLINLTYLWKDFNEKDKSGIHFHKNGMKHKKKFMGSNSYNIWLNTAAENEAPHVHMYEIELKKGAVNTLTIFRHEREKKKSIRFKRKFGVRCVKDK